jgi:pyruvate formate lyase activating enzyme
MAKEAMLYEKKAQGRVLCNLCSHRCLIDEERFGICGVRQNRGGVLYTHAYGRLISANVDPIEKKPIFHLAPGSSSYSIATIGCNFRCGFCQNWQISQTKEAKCLGLSGELSMTPEAIVNQARHTGSKSISYTYTEPTIFFEYAYETSRLAKKQGLRNIFVTNGYMTREALETIAPYLDAANVDLKSFSEDYYKKVCGARLAPVLDSIRFMKSLNIWIEVTTLLVPNLNDSKEEIERIAFFIAGLGREIPWHISRFYPQYKMNDSSPTPLSTLKMAERIGREAGLRYVYLGNVPGESESTCCYNCGRTLIKRVGFFVSSVELNDSRCPNCNSQIDGVDLT